ncbi:MAG: hypothetical protein ABF633_00415 [Clostridium sp.]|uniref:hypothetical protein n=1 Tax=Clostridium sp. TaxID=1506 RepID=UPI0039EC917D
MKESNIEAIKIGRCIIIKKFKIICIICIIGAALLSPHIARSFSNWYISEGVKNSSFITKKMQFSVYDNVVLNGASIWAAAGVANGNNIPILVKTLKSNNFIEYTKTNTYKVTDKNDPNYIDNNAKFKFSLDKDDNGDVRGIRIQQQ